MSELNLNVYAKADGTWLEFKSGGLSAVLRIETLAENHGGGIISRALRQWCQDRQADAAHICKRCGERVENGIEQEGCRDFECPEQRNDRTG